MELNYSQPISILVVECEPTRVAFWQELLANSAVRFAHVQQAESLAQACELSQQHDFDVVLLQLDLPDSQGLDTLARFAGEFPRTPLVVTSDAGEELGLQAIARGAQEYILKENCDSFKLSKAICYAIERKRFYEILDRKQKNLEAIFDAAPIAMLLIDQDRTVCRINDAVRKMVRRDFRDIINQPLGTALGCIHVPNDSTQCSQAPACADCPFPNIIDTVLNENQSVHEVELRPTLLIDGIQSTPYLSVCAEHAIIDGRDHVVVAIDDITARKEAEEELEKTMALKAQFVSTVSHELRTPLTCIKEGVSIILEGMAGDVTDEQRDLLDIAHRNVERLALLINDILDFQKLDSGRMDFDMRKDDIGPVASEVHETMVLAANKRNIELALEIEPGLPPAPFDRNRIIQVLNNLISNAIKFTPENGRVCLAIEHQADELILRISDTGLGIPKEDLPRIFDRFYRVRRPGKEIQGTGLGLAIVNQIVRRHHGRIDLESELEKGTTVTVTLPVITESADQALSEEADGLLESTLA